MIWNKGKKKYIMEAGFSMVKAWCSHVNIKLGPHAQGYFLWLFRLYTVQRHLGEEESWDTSYAQHTRQCILGWCCISYWKGVPYCNLSLQIECLFAFYLLKGSLFFFFTYVFFTSLSLLSANLVGNPLLLPL